MVFSYHDNNNQVRSLNLQVGSKWSEIEVDNQILNTIFSKVDDGDGIVSNTEITMVERLLQMADNFINKTKGNNIAETNELEKLQEQLENSDIDTDKLYTDIIKNLKIEDFNIENLRKRFPEDKYQIEKLGKDDDCSIYISDNIGAVLLVEICNGQLKLVIDSSGTFVNNIYDVNGELTKYKDKDGYHNYKVEPLAESLKTQIYQKNSLGFPMTATKLNDSIMQITPDNVIELLEDYSKIAGDNANLLEDIIEEFGIDINKRIEYLQHIKNAILEHYEQNGIYVDDISAEFDNELNIQKNKIGFANADYLNVFLNKLKNRSSSIQNNSAPNGQIDENYKQGKTGDCWLVASIVALNNTPKGREILNNTVKVNKDGSITVHLQGVNKTYTISKEELEGNTQLATGDLDVRAIEIAVNKYFYEERGVRESWLHDLLKPSLDINGNDMITAYRILVGEDNMAYWFNNVFIPIARVLELFKEIDDSLINEFNNSNKAITVTSMYRGETYSFSSSTSDNETTLYNTHAYAVKGSDAENVYLINPWDVNNIITVPREDFKKFFNYYQQKTL